MSTSPQITQKNNARRNRRSNKTRTKRRTLKKMMFTDSNNLPTAVLPQSSTTFGSSNPLNGGRSSGIVTRHSMNEWNTEITKIPSVQLVQDCRPQAEIKKSKYFKSEGESMQSRIWKAL